LGFGGGPFGFFFFFFFLCIEKGIHFSRLFPLMRGIAPQKAMS